MFSGSTINKAIIPRNVKYYTGNKYIMKPVDMKHVSTNIKRNKINFKLKPNVFQGFGEVLPTGADAPKLQVGNEYTLTLEFGGIIMPDEQKVASIAQQYIGGAIIQNVTRGMWSGRFVITFKPTTTLGLNSTVNNLIVGMKQSGYEAKLIQIESGEESTKPGGVSQVATDTGKAVKKGVITVVKAVSETASEAAGAAAKPLLPWIIGAVALLVGFTWWKVGGLDEALRPKQPSGVGKNNYRSETT